MNYTHTEETKRSTVVLPTVLSLKMI